MFARSVLRNVALSCLTLAEQCQPAMGALQEALLMALICCQCDAQLAGVFSRVLVHRGFRQCEITVLHPFAHFICPFM